MALTSASSYTQFSTVCSSGNGKKVQTWFSETSDCLFLHKKTCQNVPTVLKCRSKSTPYLPFLAVTWQLNRWPCHWLTHWLTEWATFDFQHSERLVDDILLMTFVDDNFLWQFLMTILMTFLMTIFDDNFWWQFLMTIFDDNFSCHFFMAIFGDNFWQFWQFLNVFRFADSSQIFERFSESLKVFVTWDMTLETLIAFLTIENNNMDNYIVTFE